MGAGYRANVSSVTRVVMALSLAAGLWSGEMASAAADDKPVISAGKTTDYEERGRSVDVKAR